MIEVAKREGRILMVGHFEMFNPAVQYVQKYVTDGKLGELFYLSSRGPGVYPSRFEADGKYGRISWIPGRFGPRETTSKESGRSTGHSSKWSFDRQLNR